MAGTIALVSRRIDWLLRSTRAMMFAIVEMMVRRY